MAKAIQDVGDNHHTVEPTTSTVAHVEQIRPQPQKKQFLLQEGDQKSDLNQRN